MDILNPELEWIDGRCYRKLPIRVEKNSNEKLEDETPTIIRKYANNEEVYDEGLPIHHKENRFFFSFNVAKEFIKFIVGTKGGNRKRMEDETATLIKIPEQNRRQNFEGSIQEDEVEITITGQRKSDVAAAYRKIQDLTVDVRFSRMDHTHFLSVPMNNETIKTNFQKFKKEILSEMSGNEGIDDSTFESPSALHLTLAMLTLLSKSEKEKASSMLQKSRDKIMEWLDGKPLDVEVRGVEYMNDDPKEVRVLYGKVKEKDNNCLQLIADMLADEFTKALLSKRELDENVHIKLHVTLMKGRSKGAHRTFDASRILEKYADYSFGWMRVSDIHISVRYAQSRNGYWIPFFVLQLK